MCSSALSVEAVLGLVRTPVWDLSLFLGLSRNCFKVPATMCLCEAVASVVIVGAERSRVATSRLSLASCSLVRLGEEEEEGERKLDEERRKEEEQMKRGRTKTGSRKLQTYHSITSTCSTSFQTVDAQAQGSVQNFVSQLWRKSPIFLQKLQDKLAS